MLGVMAWLVLWYAAVVIVFALVLRFGGKAALERVRAFNKRILNPAMMRLAGRRHWYAAVIKHEGRRSGREYATPVVAVPVEGGRFMIPLPYGEEVDWLKNVLAARRAKIETKSKTYAVVEPEVVDAAAAFPLLAERHRRAWRLFRIERFLTVKQQPETGAEGNFS